MILKSTAISVLACLPKEQRVLDRHVDGAGVSRLFLGLLTVFCGEKVRFAIKKYEEPMLHSCQLLHVFFMR